MYKACRSFFVWGAVGVLAGAALALPISFVVGLHPWLGILLFWIWFPACSVMMGLSIAAGVDTFSNMSDPFYNGVFLTLGMAVVIGFYAGISRLILELWRGRRRR